MTVLRKPVVISLLSIAVVLFCNPVTAQQSLPSVDELVKKLAPRPVQDGMRGGVPAQPVKKRRTRGLVMDDDAADQPESVSGSSPAQSNDVAPAPLANATAVAPVATPIQPSVVANPANGVVAPAQRPAELAVAPARPAQPAPPASNAYSESRITFEFGSDQLTPYAKRVLDVFGAAIQSPQLQNVQFIIEGHTDGVGSDQYNLELSRKRAESVIRYLIDSVRVDPTRLAARGKGRRELINPNDPGSPDNRRVVWVSQQ